MAIILEKLKTDLLKNSSNDPVALIELFKNYLAEIEQESCADLTVEHSLALDEDLNYFKELGEDIFKKAENFFKSYYMITQEASTMLNPKILLDKFSVTLTHLNNLQFAIANNAISHKEEILTCLEEHQLKLENRSYAIKTEQKYFKPSVANFIDKQVRVEVNDDDFRFLILELEKHPSPLIGMNDLLNYQYLQILDTNELIAKRAIELLDKYDLKHIYIKDDDEIDEEKYNAFCEQVAEDKQRIIDILESDILDEDAEDELLEIAEEVSLNILYRLAWNEDYKLIPNA